MPIYRHSIIFFRYIADPYPPHTQTIVYRMNKVRFVSSPYMSLLFAELHMYIPILTFSKLLINSALEQMSISHPVTFPACLLFGELVTHPPSAPQPWSRLPYVG